MSEITWTEEELKEFDALTWKVSSINQITRIAGRFEMNQFVSKHGKEKCDAMWAHLLEKDKKKKSKKK